jgi:hypothetical protein
MKKLVLREEHEEAGKVLHLHRKPRRVVASGPDGQEFVSQDWHK